jgi:CubicO group peptidase (beta-lactamase class C family)
MWRVWSGLLLALSVALPAGSRVAAQPAQAPSSDAFIRAETAIRAEMQKAGIPGAAIAVVVGDRVAWVRGFGIANIETGTPVTPDSLFQIGSVTKTFTAAALLSAARDGIVALDRPVSTYVSGLAPCVGRPTLRQLLSHTGGLIDEPAEFGPPGEEGLAAYPRTWTSEYCLLAPGRVFSYSNSGFALAGLALQEVDRKPFADVMRARVLAPLGMARTTFRPAEAMSWPVAVGHRKAKDGALEVVRPLANDARLWPAGTLYSSANEMARFALALLNDGRVEGRQALPAGLVASMRGEVARVPTTGEAYGQGLFLGRMSHEFGHGGTMTGYAAQLTVSEQDGFDNGPKVAVVVLTNGDGANPEPLLRLALAAARTDASGHERLTFADQAPLPTRVLTPAGARAFTGT